MLKPYQILLCYKDVNGRTMPNYGQMYATLIYTTILLTVLAFTPKMNLNNMSLEGYEYCIDGHVQPVMFHNPEVDDYVYLMANVLPSQRQSGKKIDQLANLHSDTLRDLAPLS